MSEPTGDIQHRGTFRAPPMPPPEGSAPPAAAAPAAPASVPHTGNPPIPLPPQNAPVQPIAPKPAPAASAPAPHPTAQPAPPAPVQAAAPSLTDDVIVRVPLQGGVQADVKLSDLKRTYGITNAAEARLAKANQQLLEQSQAISRGEELLAVQRLAQTNPEAAARRLAELTGVPIGVAPKVEDDDGLDPAARDIRNRLGQVEQVTGEFKRLQSEDRVRQMHESIKSAVRSYPAYAQDEAWAQEIDGFVAAQVVQPNNQLTLHEIVARIHAKDHDRMSAQLTRERDTRAANVQALASVPAGVGTPALTDNALPPAPKGMFHKPGGIKADLADLTSRVLRAAT